MIFVRAAGIVTTTRVTHASPAGTYAKTANRGWENDAAVRAAGHDTQRCPDIAHQLVHMEPGNRFKNDATVRAAGHDTQRCPDIAHQLVHMESGNRFKVILGGGRREFLPNATLDEEGTRGLRTDERDLIQEWQDDKQVRNLSHAYVWHAAELRALAADPPEYLLGLFEGTHLRYNMEGNPESEPTLAELTEVAIKSLSRNEKGFFLFVEAGRIDHAHHGSYPQLALDETIELSAAVERATELLSEEDSLIVVTSDHAHVMAINGYTRRGGDILGPSDDIGDDGVPYMTLSYTNGPGARVHENGVRPDVTQDDDYLALRWRAPADVPLGSETHGGDDVAVFARGTAHGMFSGLYEQSQLPHLMAYAACIGPGPHAPACSGASLASPRALTVFAPLLAALLALIRY
ncbi:Alkaline phosphatase [Operophtera brumata]|uniref:alkaline phosphatase n=1 Tax=Operophtera brumata TaxID=104452 RepID=A0A0L7L7Z9_OPEBR|nr:Alkaline phosphatase [Operophtera brumata]